MLTISLNFIQWGVGKKIGTLGKDTSTSTSTSTSTIELYLKESLVEYCEDWEQNNDTKCQKQQKVNVEVENFHIIWVALKR